MSLHLELLEILQRQEMALPPDHLCGDAKSRERADSFRRTTNPELLRLIEDIEEAERRAFANTELA